MKITVVGAGYVGLSNALLLSQHNKIILLDIVTEKLVSVNNWMKPIEEPRMQAFLNNANNRITATTHAKSAFFEADYITVATDYDVQTSFFNTLGDVILANRMTPELEPIADKVVARDLFGDN